MTPELLWFLSAGSDEVPDLALSMPDGSLVFAYCHVNYVMTADDWWHFSQMREAVAR